MEFSPSDNNKVNGEELKLFNEFVVSKLRKDGVLSKRLLSLIDEINKESKSNSSSVFLNSKSAVSPYITVVKNNDNIISKEDVLSAPFGIERLVFHNADAPHSLYESLILLLHCFLIDAEFICVYEQPNSVPGFAPSLKDLPKNMFLPMGWRNGYGIIYKHKLKPGQHYILKVSNRDIFYLYINHYCIILYTVYFKR